MSNQISLIPYPFILENKDGIFSFSNFLVNSDFSDQLNLSITEQILNKTNINCSIIPSNSEKANLILIKTSSYLNYDLSDKEAYCLTVKDNAIIIYASKENGAFYGIITLCQLLLTYEHTIPCTFIYDKPSFSWRGFLLDTSRSFYTVDFIKKAIDLCAFHKLNTFHWHLTDDQGWRFPVEGYPLLTEIGSKRMAARKPLVMEGLNEDDSYRDRFYTREEINDIVCYASRRFINIVPEVDLPGHSSALLASYPEFGCTGGPYQVEHRWGIFPDILCAGNDKIFTIYDAIFKSLSELFPGQYVHIGGDECRTSRWDKCPKCQKRIKDEKLDNSKQLQTWVTAKMVSILEKYDKIAIGWDEVLDNTEKIPVPSNLIVQSWRGIEGGEKAAELNHKVIMSPQTMCYLNLKPYDNFEEPGMLGFTTIYRAYKFSPITKGIKKEQEHNIIGGECALWTEELRSSRLAEYLIFPRLCALSECLWLKESDKNYDRFIYNLKEHKKRLDNLDVLYYKGPAK